MEDKIKAALDEIRIMLQADGGDLELVSIEGMTVNVRLKGACGSCPHALITLKQGVEEHLKQNVDPAIIVERAE